MAAHEFDARGLKCPMPVVKINSVVVKYQIKPGDTLDILADCPTFEKDLKEWGVRQKKAILSIKDEGGYKRAKVAF
jgi:tRNA 2-thiouridine synthesizing protein A